jgi:hypothetical protein
MVFNSDEDLVLVAADGRGFIIDIFQGTIRTRFELETTTGNFKTKEGIEKGKI